MNQEKLLKIQRKVSKYLDDYRYRHTLGVMYCAGALAMCHEEDVERAMIAGLLHDCAKCIPAEKKIRMCKKNDIPITDVEYSNPGLLHAKLGAYIAREKYNIEDEDILSAIVCHTTGKPDMNTMEKILYVADYIEPGRAPLPGIDLVRSLAFKDLDLCVYTILKDSYNYLQSRNYQLDPMTEKAYHYYRNLINDSNSQEE